MASTEASDLAGQGVPEDEGRRATYIIAAAAGVTGTSFNIWYPFLPLYALELGAKSDADAVAWVALAITMQGVARLASSAAWGYLSDRWGRKMMLLRALYLASFTFAFAAVAQEPWQLSIALACQGLFSGYVPASVALVSVLVPDHRLSRSLSTVTGAQHLGSTTGPAVGALLALAFDFRTTIIVASVIPLITATAVLLWVPRDRIVRRAATAGQKSDLEPFKATPQFVLAVAALFSVYTMNELVRLSTPIALKALNDGANAAAATGLTFSIAGLASAFSVLFLAPLVFSPGRIARAFGGACAMGAVGALVLAMTESVPVYIAGFLVVALVVSALVPAINTRIAESVTRSRRGTGFGIAATAQSLSFAIGPASAALFVAISQDLGFAVLAGGFLALGVVMFSGIREGQAAHRT
jgi:DHA1 family multidrug resistance protein-like MFS transporter